MKQNSSVLVLTLFLLLSQSTFSQSSASLIQKKWVAIGIRGSREAQRDYAASHSISEEIQFKNGIFSSYENGVIQGTGRYTMADDGKSLVVEDVNHSLPMKIILLNQESLHLIMMGTVSNRDTVTYIVSGSAKHNALLQQRGNEKQSALGQSWQALNDAFQKKQNVIKQLVSSLNNTAGFDTTALRPLINAYANASAIRFNLEQLNKQNILRVSQTQSELSGAYSRLWEHIWKKYPQLKSQFSEVNDEVEKTDNTLATLRLNYNRAVLQYNQSQKAKGRTTRDIFYQAYISEHQPKVSFD